MVRIRLRRTGKKGQPSYRVIVADKEAPRDGKFIENIGFYNPQTDPPTMQIDTDRAKYWLSLGAQPSDAVARLLHKAGVEVKVKARAAAEPAIGDVAASAPVDAEAQEDAAA